MRERLYRSRDDRMLFGVAGGMAEYMDLDPAIVRLAWALLILAAGVGLALYVVAAIVIPEAPLGAGVGDPGDTSAGTAATAAMGTPARRRRRGNGSAGMLFGVVLVIAGVWFLLDRYVKDLDLSWFGPGALIVVGIVLVVGALGRPGRSDG